MELHGLKERLLGKKVRKKLPLASLKEGDIVEIIEVDHTYIYGMVKNLVSDYKSRKAIGYTKDVLRGVCNYTELVEGILPTGERILSCQRTS